MVTEEYHQHLQSVITILVQVVSVVEAITLDLKYLRETLAKGTFTLVLRQGNDEELLKRNL